MSHDNPHEELWRTVLQEGFPDLLHKRLIFGWLPANPRCSVCNTPFKGFGGFVTRTFLKRVPSNYNPRMCSACEEMCRKYPGGAEVELTLLFADVRGSTRIAEGMSPSAFSRLMDRFYTVSTDAVMQTDGIIEKFVGDNATILFPPGISGQDHAQKAIDTARHMLEATGHASGEPWLPVGAGIHTGVAYVGAVGSGGVVQLTALGDTANAAARLAGEAGPGEILISDAACKAAGLDTEGLERRSLTLKGRSEPMQVCVLRVN